MRWPDFADLLLSLRANRSVQVDFFMCLQYPSVSMHVHEIKKNDYHFNPTKKSYISYIQNPYGEHYFFSLIDFTVIVKTKSTRRM